MYGMNRILFIAIGLLPVLSQAQYLQYPNAEQEALLNANVVPFGSEALKINPAGIVSVSKFTFRSTYRNRYQISSLSNLSFGFVSPLGGGVVGVALDHFGFSHIYQTNHLSLAYALHLTPDLSLAIQPKYRVFRLLDVYFHHTVSIASGVRFSLSKEVFLGAYWSDLFSYTFQNPYETSITDPPFFSVGFGYVPTVSWVKYYGSLSKFTDRPLAIQVGLESFWREFIFRVSLSHRPMRLGVGMRIPLPGAILDMGVSYHYTLGFAPCLTVTI